MHLPEAFAGCLHTQEGGGAQCLWFDVLQVDLSTHPSKRGVMLAGSDNNTKLPQLHVNGQVGRNPCRCQVAGSLQCKAVHMRCL